MQGDEPKTFSDLRNRLRFLLRQMLGGAITFRAPSSPSLKTFLAQNQIDQHAADLMWREVLRESGVKPSHGKTD